MQEANPNNDEAMLEPPAMSTVAIARLTVGAVQGLLLYFLYKAAQSGQWPATAPYLFVPLLLLGVLLPVLLISMLGHLDRRHVVAWTGGAFLIIALLGVYDIWRGVTDSASLSRAIDSSGIRYPSVLLAVFLAVGFFIAQSLVLAAAAEKRRVARYAVHFELAWKLMIQALFSTLFVAVLWAALWMGAALFMLVKLDFLKQLLQQSWFVIPVTAFAFSCAMHITDVRPAIVRGIRSLLLVLLSWILPVTALLVAGFLFSMPVTGLQPLWATRSATAVLLGASAVLIVLINAAFQNGERPGDTARVVRWSARVAAIALLPLVAIAVYALSLRVSEYGWTTDRIIAAAALLIAACYACGYAWAACQRSGWLSAVAPVNVAAAYLILAVLLALFSPLADPARLSVNDQVARLSAGKTAAAAFDYDYLRFEGARYGLAALDRLKAHTDGAEAAAIRENALRAIGKKQRYADAPAKAAVDDIAANIKVWPLQARLPESFLRQDWSKEKRPWEMPACLQLRGKSCEAYLIDVTADGKPEILLFAVGEIRRSLVMAEDATGKWSLIGRLPESLVSCEFLRQRLAAGDYRMLPPRVSDLNVGGMRIEIIRENDSPDFRCPAPPK
jgi:hypothetical protein